MASRLIRWSAVTIVALGAAMAVLLPPGDSFLALWNGSTPAHPTNALDAAVEADRVALDEAQFQLRRIRLARAIAPHLPHGPAPVALNAFQDTVTADPALTLLADSIWRTVSRHPDAPRTLLLATRQRWSTVDYSPTDPRICVARVWTPQHVPLRSALIRSGAGACLLATEFGPPGKGLDGWLKMVGNIALPGTVHRGQRPIEVIGPSEPEIFTGYQEYYERRRWWSTTGLDACIGGRSDYCVDALGFGTSGIDSLTPWYRYYMVEEVHSALPATLLAELGPDRFAAIWQSDDPLPVAYEKTTGRPFDQWALDFVQHRLGRLEKDNGLSFAGWGGWACWMVLFFAWLAVRMREQPAA